MVYLSHSFTLEMSVISYLMCLMESVYICFMLIQKSFSFNWSLLVFHNYDNVIIDIVNVVGRKVVLKVIYSPTPRY